MSKEYRNQQELKYSKYLSKAGFFFVRTQKKLKGAKTQENGNSRKKLKLKEKIPFSGIF